jgi:hypothetical protein
MSLQDNKDLTLSDTASCDARKYDIVVPAKEVEKEGRTPTETLALEDSDAKASGHIGMSSPRKNVVMLAMCLGIFVTQLDIYIMTTTLPKIASDLGASDSSYAWTGSAYLLACASFIPVWGGLSEMLGRKAVIEINCGLFMLGTLLGAMSGTPAVLIVSRAVQGCAAGGIPLVIFIYIADVYAPRCVYSSHLNFLTNERGRERALYFGLVGVVVAIASPIGPFIGGALADKLDWRWCFWINRKAYVQRQSLTALTQNDCSTLNIYFTARHFSIPEE